MSSHHIVREKQEPALLVLGLESFAAELLGQLLEWSPTVIVTAHTAEKIHASGIKIDWLIGNDLIEDFQTAIKLLPAGAGTIVHAALEYLVAHNYHAVNVIADELLLEDYLHYIDKIDVVIFYAGKKIFAVKSGFSKWKTAGETLEILTPVHHLATDGLVSTGDHLFKTTKDGFFTITFDQPFFIHCRNTLG